MSPKTQTMAGGHISLEPSAVENGKAILCSAMEYGFVGPLDIPVAHFHPELQVMASFIREARDEGAKEFADIIAHLMQTREPGEAQDLTRASLAELAQGLPHRPESLERSAEIVRNHHLAYSRFLASCKLQKILEAGEDPADALQEVIKLEAENTGTSRSMLVRGVKSYPTVCPPESILLGNDWGRRGDVLTFISTAGAGKSVAVTQAAMAWGLGLKYLEIEPARPLRILLFSGEDDGVTIGQCREGFLENSKAITGRQLTAQDLDLLDSMLRIEFIREHVGEHFHSHLARLLKEEPADLVIVNPLLSYLGGEVVAVASKWLRGGLMPILQEYDCAALVAHHTPKLAKDGWENTDDTYSAIGGAELANIPRAILTLRPTGAEGLSVLKVSKRQTTGWKDAYGKYVSHCFIKRTEDPTRPAWIPIDSGEAEEMISNSKQSGNAKQGSKKVTPEKVVEIVTTQPVKRQDLIARVRALCECGESTADRAIKDAQEDGLIEGFDEPNSHGGKPIKWLRIPTEEQLFTNS